MESELSSWLQGALDRYALSQADLARRTGLHPSTISQLLSGKSRGYSKTRRSLAQGLGLLPQTFARAVEAGTYPEPDAGPSIGVVEAIKRDPRLTPTQADLLIALYRQFVSQGR